MQEPLKPMQMVLDCGSGSGKKPCGDKCELPSKCPSTPAGQCQPDEKGCYACDGSTYCEAYNKCQHTSILCPQMEQEQMEQEQPVEMMKEDVPIQPETPIMQE